MANSEEEDVTIECGDMSESKSFKVVTNCQVKVGNIIEPGMGIFIEGGFKHLVEDKGANNGQIYVLAA